MLSLFLHFIYIYQEQSSFLLKASTYHILISLQLIILISLMSHLI